jgi:Lar family restriction alleviation protein
MRKICCKIYNCPELDVEAELCKRDEVEITEYGCSTYAQFKFDRKARKIGIELKPCPFCGGKAELLYDSIGNGCYAVCKKCYVLSDRKKDAKEVADAWNARTDSK